MRVLFTTIAIMFSLNAQASEYFKCELWETLYSTDTGSSVKEISDWLFRRDKSTSFRFDIPNTRLKLHILNITGIGEKVLFSLNEGDRSVHSKGLNLEPLFSGSSQRLKEDYRVDSKVNITFRCELVEKEELIYKMAKFMDKNGLDL
jgi:hypothetical protein